ncbi:M48 family metalloprotease [Magnetospira sp. QH-2]|uniref:M48 family metalloprotease n=1 Tax=Magnetospira sp. (strain QH-2) TaxID=1288970 RepID=UPI0003E80FF5|nr:M48 family metalloprotease [Magnetospira sp. QH-2]CCQ74909.1 putative Zn-dependent protease [Magnetospira sp. QH-2]
MTLTRRQFTTGLVAAGALGSLPGCIATNPATGRTSFTGVYSIDDDVALGKKENPGLVKAFGGRYEDARLESYVTSIGKELGKRTEHPDLPYTFTILNTPIVNAFALPGGYVSVSRGLVALASNEAELAGVLAHELGHVNARHTAERLSQSMLAQVGLTVLSVATGSSAVSQIGGLAANAFLQSYSRQQEFEADMLGVRYISRSGYDPDAMVTFLDTLRDHSQVEAEIKGLPKGSVDEFNMMSTHPRTVDRVQAAIEHGKQYRSANPVLARERYLDHIDGMLYGEDPEQGLIIGQRFVHPTLRMEFTVPKGFQLHNTESKVIAKHPKGAAIVFDMDRPEKNRDVVSYLRDEWGRKASFSDVEPLTVNGLQAATGMTKISGKDVRPVVFRNDAESVFRFLFITPPQQTAAFNVALRETTYSFKRLSEREAANVKPLRLRISRGQTRESLDRLASNLPYGEYNHAAFRVLNDLKPGQPLPDRGDLKMIVH